MLSETKITIADYLDALRRWRAGNFPAADLAAITPDLDRGCTPADMAEILRLFGRLPKRDAQQALVDRGLLAGGDRFRPILTENLLAFEAAIPFALASSDRTEPSEFVLTADFDDGVIPFCKFPGGPIFFAGDFAKLASKHFLRAACSDAVIESRRCCVLGRGVLQFPQRPLSWYFTADVVRLSAALAEEQAGEMKKRRERLEQSQHPPLRKPVVLENVW